MSKIAIITARGGSKRIPRKNIRDFLGKPIIAYSIQAAIDSKIFDEIMVSTDDHEIANIAVLYGASVPFLRSPENSDDFATTSDVLKEVINNYQDQGRVFEIACCLYPTAPFVTPNLLMTANEILINQNNIDLVLPVVPYSFPVQRSFLKSSNNMVSYAFPEYVNKRSQDLEKYYHDTGQFYMFKVNDFLKRNSIAGPNMYGLEISELRVQDIDNESDWKLAELKYQLLSENN